VIKVYTSDSGQYVLVHPASQTFIIDESLEQGFRRLEDHVRSEHPEMAGRVMEVDEKPRDNRAANSRIAQLALLVALALLPFVWLLVMQQSLAALLADVRLGSGLPAEAAVDQAALREELDLVRLELNRVLEALHTVNMQVLEMQQDPAMEEETAATESDDVDEANGTNEEAAEDTESGTDAGG
jgi:hypothetical protein